MEDKTILRTESIQVADLNNDDYKINTYSYEGKYNGEVIVSKDDIERIYYSMKLNETNK